MSIMDNKPIDQPLMANKKKKTTGGAFPACLKGTVDASFDKDEKNLKNTIQQAAAARRREKKKD